MHYIAQCKHYTETGNKWMPYVTCNTSSKPSCCSVMLSDRFKFCVLSWPFLHDNEFQQKVFVLYVSVRIAYTVPQDMWNCYPLIIAVFLFSSFRTSIYGSAVCAYNISALNTAFSGPYKYQENAQMAWTRVPNTSPTFKVCNFGFSLLVNSSHQLAEYDKHSIE